MPGVNHVTRRYNYSAMKNKYLAVNVCFLADLFKDKETTINNMLRGGLYRYASNIKLTLENAVTLCLYDYLNNKPLPGEVADIFNGYDVQRDECFVAGNFFAPDDIVESFNHSDNEELFEYAQMVTACNNMGVNPANMFIYLSTCRNIKTTSTVVAMINKSKLFEFRDENKTEHELMQFACYVAIKSIIGRNKFAKTNIQYILSRALPDAENEAQNALRIKYQKRRKFESIMQALELNWGVKRYSSFMRGFYLATDGKTSIEELALIAESSKKKNRVEKLKNSKRDAKRLALENVQNMYT